MTHDVQLPDMMCNYTNYTRKINALPACSICTVGSSVPGPARWTRTTAGGASAFISKLTKS